MKTIDIIRRAGRNLRQSKARTILTSLAISVGAFTIALAMAAGNGGRAYMENIVGSLGSRQDINVSRIQESKEKQGPKKIGESQEVLQGSLVLTDKDKQVIEKIDGVDRVLTSVSVSATSFSVNNVDKYEGNIVPQADGSTMNIVAGSLGSDGSIRQGTIVLPRAYLEAFDFSSPEAAIGKIVHVELLTVKDEIVVRDFTISAVEDKPSSGIGYYQDQFRISNADGIEIAALQTPKGAEGTYYGFMVKAKPGADVSRVKIDIEKSGPYTAQTFLEMRSAAMAVVNTAQYGLIGFGLLAIIASVFGIINTQYISVLERTQQIGLMKALGMPKAGIGKLFRYEAAWIGCLGGVIGIAMAYCVTLFNPMITEALNLESGTRLLQLDWISSIVLIASLMAVAVISGWFPSRKAAKLDPIEALRTE